MSQQKHTSMRYTVKCGYLFYVSEQVDSADFSKPQLPDRLRSHSPVSGHHCHSLAHYHSTGCWSSLQPPGLADWLRLLSLLWNHPRQDVEGVLHLQQPQQSEEGAVNLKQWHSMST